MWTVWQVNYPQPIKWVILGCLAQRGGGGAGIWEPADLGSYVKSVPYRLWAVNSASWDLAS